jgi:hypothetical protein
MSRHEHTLSCLAKGTGGSLVYVCKDGEETEKKRYDPKVKMRRVARTFEGSHVVDIDEFSSQPMTESDAKEVVGAVRAWTRYVRKLSSDIEASRSVDRVGDGVFVDYRPHEERGSSFPSVPLVETKDREKRDAAVRKLRSIALRIRQGTRHPSYSQLPPELW